METTLGVGVAFAPEATAVALGYAAVGVALGTLSGLTPGLHANTLALLLAAAAPSLPGPPRLVAAAMLAAGVVHTFLDVVPSLALGVPDAAMAASALPGHRLVLAGRGREALRLSALGSGLAVAAALPLAVPVTLAMLRAYPVVRAWLPAVLAAVGGVLLATEPTRRAAAGGALSFAASAALGSVVLDLSPSAPVAAGGVLTPTFAGLFGAPVLLDALGGSGVPPQGDARVTTPPRTLARLAGAGTLAGALVGYLPGVSSAVASVLALAAVPGSDTGERRGDGRAFVVATSGANTANTVFALFALAALGVPRTGVMVAVSRAGAAPAADATAGTVASLAPLLAAAVVGAAAGAVLVVRAGDPYLRLVGRVDPRRLVVGVLALLACLSWLFAGVVGVGILVAATAVGLLPPRLGTRRVHLMGVLVGPLMLGV